VFVCFECVRGRYGVLMEGCRLLLQGCHVSVVGVLCFCVREKERERDYSNMNARKRESVCVRERGSE
jgi:hypothetical protein